MPAKKTKTPSIREKPYVLYFNGSMLYYTRGELAEILENWGSPYYGRFFPDHGTFTTGLGSARWERRQKK